MKKNPSIKKNLSRSIFTVIDYFFDGLSTFGVIVTIVGGVSLVIDILLVFVSNCYKDLGTMSWIFADNQSTFFLEYGTLIGIFSFATLVTGFLLSISIDIYRWTLRSISEYYENKETI